MKITPGFLARALLATMLLTWTSRAADHVVHMTAVYSFSPDRLEIQAGDTVTWYNDDDFDSHDASSDTGLWSTGDVQSAESATLPFNAPGTYEYRDSLYSSLGMKGTIVVNATATVAQAVITEPLILPDGAFRFTITNLMTGKTNIIETSTNLVQWTALATNIPSGNTLNFTNAPATGQQFFRSWQLP